MDDKLKRQLYDYFLKDTPLSFESVTDKQWSEMQATLTGFGITLTSIVSDVAQAITSLLQPVVSKINDTLKKETKK